MRNLAHSTKPEEPCHLALQEARSLFQRKNLSSIFSRSLTTAKVSVERVIVCPVRRQEWGGPDGVASCKHFSYAVNMDSPPG